MKRIENEINVILISQNVIRLNLDFSNVAKRKENVRSTFLAHGRAGALAIFSCHPYREQDQNLYRPMDDN